MYLENSLLRTIFSPTSKKSTDFFYNEVPLFCGVFRPSVCPLLLNYESGERNAGEQVFSPHKTKLEKNLRVGDGIKQFFLPRHLFPLKHCNDVKKRYRGLFSPTFLCFFWTGKLSYLWRGGRKKSGLRSILR